MKRLNKKGFTLIELLAVIVILAIVAAVTMTVVIPMISSKPKEAAQTSISNMRQQIVNACSGLGVEGVPGADLYGTFAGTVTAPASGTVNDCLTGTCTMTFTATNLSDMKISGELPQTSSVSFNKCSITGGTFTFSATEGQFKGLTVTLDGNGTATAAPTP